MRSTSALTTCVGCSPSSTPEALASLGLATEPVADPAWPPRRTGHRPFTHSARDTLERALREAQHLRSRRIGPEHLLLGLLGVPDTDAAALVTDRLGVDRAQGKAALAATVRCSA